VFISSHVVTTDGTLASWFQPGAKVEFRAFAIDTKTKKMVQAKDVKFFYVKIPNQPNVKLKYNGTLTTMKNMPWSGSWTVPATYPLGEVPFKMLIKLTS